MEQILTKKEQSIDYKKNLKSLVGWERSEVKILNKTAGILKGVFGTNSVQYQKKARKEWDVRVKKIEKSSKK